MIETNGLSFFKQFFNIIWNFLINTNVPCTSIPFAALIFGPFALAVLLGALDKILGFSMPGLFSTIGHINAKEARDSLKAGKGSDA